MPDTIKRISGQEILDSRGNPTVEVTVELQSGVAAKASVPAGASRGTFEAHELRDEDSARYGGKGVLKAVDNVNSKISKALIGVKVTEQNKLDQLMRELDGTENKSNLGANAILGVSLACARTASKSLGMPLYQYLGDLYGNKKYILPIPLMNLINGGLHANTNLNLQEFWLIPTQTTSFSDRLRCGSEVFQHLGTILRRDGRDTDLGNEGGYAPDLDSHRQAFEYVAEAIVHAGYGLGKECFMGFDAGSNTFYDHEKQMYVLKLEKSEYSSSEFIKYIWNFLEKYPILAIEDPLDEEDWDAWVKLTSDVKQKWPTIRVIGDDLFVTNFERLQKGMRLGAANTILIKPNQIGTLSETIACIKLAKQNGYQTVISHRSGETIDSFIADLAVAVASEFIKSGSVAQGERSAKYNRLLNIEAELHGQ